MEQSLTKSRQLEQELLEFVVAVIEYVETQNLPRYLADQVVRSATSIGANYAEALNASSKTDFRNKIYIAKKETAETKYWLNVISKLKNIQPNYGLLDQCQKFLMVFQKTVNTINGQRKSKDQ